MTEPTVGYDQACGCAQCRHWDLGYANGYAAAAEGARQYVEMLGEIGSTLTADTLLSWLDDRAAHLSTPRLDSDHRWPGHA